MESFNDLYRTLVGHTFWSVCSEALRSITKDKKGQEKIS
jgi:hypothetical protein